MRNVTSINGYSYQSLLTMEKRFRLLVGAKLPDKDKVLRAVAIQQEIRKKYGQKEKGWDSVSQIRKQRDNRCL